MSSGLIEALIKKEAFSNETVVTAFYNSIDLFGRSFRKKSEFRVSKIVGNIFELLSLQDNRIVKTTSNEISTIDGMNLDRYADIYDLNPDGTSKKVGKKRGRKPKEKFII